MNKMATIHLKDERITTFQGKCELSHSSYVWVSTTTLLCFIFLPVLDQSHHMYR